MHQLGRVIALLVARKLLDRRFARNMLSWRHSGFSVDNSVRILDPGVQRSLAEYVSRPAISAQALEEDPEPSGESRSGATGTRSDHPELNGYSAQSRTAWIAPACDSPRYRCHSHPLALVLISHDPAAPAAPRGCFTLVRFSITLPIISCPVPPSTTTRPAPTPAHDANYATFHRIDGFRREL